LSFVVVTNRATATRADRRPARAAAAAAARADRRPARADRRPARAAPARAEKGKGSSSSGKGWQQLDAAKDRVSIIVDDGNHTPVSRVMLFRTYPRNFKEVGSGTAAVFAFHGLCAASRMKV
jgi:hypothetical protein